MSIVSSRQAEPTSAHVPLTGCARDRLLIGFVILALARCPEALCAEHAPYTARPRGLPEMDVVLQPIAMSVPLMRAPVQSFRDFFAVPRLPPEPAGWGREFSLRRPSIAERVDDSRVPIEAPMLRSTTVWQRLSEYRSRDRVRVLTLWESAASTVSLQAGRKGSPSLQWTSRSMNRGGATRGLLDQLFAVSIAGASSGFHGGSRTASVAQPGIKPIRLEAASKER